MNAERNQRFAAVMVNWANWSRATLS